MEYRDIKEFPKYKALVEKYTHLKPLKDSAYIIFLDGKDATKYHNKDFFSENGFTYHIMEAACSVVSRLGIPCEVYAAMDEVSISIPDGNVLRKCFGEEDEDRILTLFSTLFMRQYHYDDTVFTGVIHPIEKNEIPMRTAFRKLCCKYTSLEYFAKEYLGSQYDHHNAENIRQKLDDEYLLSEYEKMPWFYEGLYRSFLEEWEKEDASTASLPKSS